MKTLMKNDFISFQIQPVAGYTDLFSANDRLVQNNYDVLPSSIELMEVENDRVSEFRIVDVDITHFLSPDNSRRVTFRTPS